MFAEGDKKSWVHALAYREWLRWAVFVEAGKQEVPVDLAHLPQHIWNQVLRLCLRFQHRCDLDSALADVQHLTKSCGDCVGYSTNTCLPSVCTPQYCERCVGHWNKAMLRLRDTNRKITARVIPNKK